MEGVLFGEKFVRCLDVSVSTVGTRAVYPLHMNMCQCICTNCKTNLYTFHTIHVVMCIHTCISHEVHMH